MFEGVGLTVLRAPVMVCWNLLCGSTADGSALTAQWQAACKI